MATKQRIETPEQIWEAAIAETPVDDSGPRFCERGSKSSDALGVALLCGLLWMALGAVVWVWQGW